MARHRVAVWLLRKIFFLNLLYRASIAMVGLQVNISAPETPLRNVLHIVTPDAGGVVVVGGRNGLYELSADTLSLESIFPTRPINDSQGCSSRALPCDYDGTATDYDNHILVPLQSGSLVMACGRRGVCSVHQPSYGLNMTSRIDGTFIGNNSASRPVTVAFFGSGRNRNVLFVASTFGGEPYDYQPHALSALILTTADTFSLRSSTPEAVSYLSVADSFKNSYRVRYLYGFSYNGFAYFVTVQNTGGSFGTVETKLARVCESDVSFQTYSELPIQCPRKAGGTNSRQRIAISAAFDHSLTRNKSHRKVLAVAFRTPYGGMWNASDQSQGSELCFFDMDRVEAAFQEAMKSCNKGLKAATLIQYFGKNELDSNCATTNETDGYIDACKPGANTHVAGLFPLIGRATLDFQGLVTSITVMQQNAVIVAWVGDNSGYLHKVKLDGEKSKLLFWTDLAQGENVPIAKSTALDKEEAYGYFLLRNKVVKFPVGSCSIYQTCSKCLRGHEDPLRCGWCGGRCAHAAECRNGTDLAFDRCPVEVHMVYPRNGPIAGGTMLTFLGDNFGYWWREASNSIKITVGGRPCQIINWVFTLVKCQTPGIENATKVDITISVNDTNRDAKKTYDVLDTLMIPSYFEYKVAKVSEVLPQFGPRAGGTNITLRGLNLDIGSHRTVTVSGNPCKIHKVTETELECATASVRATEVHRDMQVTLSIDGAAVPYTSQEGFRTKFNYMPDPVIDGIAPRMANFSETPTIEVRGVHLDSVSHPRMVIQVASSSKQQEESISRVCHVLDNGKRMVCPGPSVADFSIVNSTELEAHGRKMVAHIRFMMDGWHLPIQTAGSKGYFTFVYCPARPIDGCGDEILENKMPSLSAVLPRYGPVAGGTKLTLFGNNLDSGSVRVVRIGGSNCKINSVSSAFVDCTTSAVAPGEANRDQRVIFTIDSTEVPFARADDFTSIFTYKPDPVIYEIKPPRGIFSGLSNIDVRGKHLDSAAAPFMMTQVVSFNRQEDHTGGVCRVVQGGRRMLCPVASAVNSCVTGSIRPEAHSSRVLVKISFQMDGLRLLANETAKERQFHCTFHRETNLTSLPQKKPDSKKDADAMHEPPFIAISLGIATFFVIGIALGTVIFLAKCTRTSYDDKWLVFVGANQEDGGQQEKGNAQDTNAQGLKFLTDSNFKDETGQNTFRRKQLLQNIRLAPFWRAIQHWSAHYAIGKHSSREIHVNVHSQLISEGAREERRGDNERQPSSTREGEWWP